MIKCHSSVSLKMADILERGARTNSRDSQRKLHVLCPESESIHCRLNDVDKQFVMNEFEKSCADSNSISVWSPPNTPPNKYVFPRFPSFGPNQGGDGEPKDTKVTPPRGRPKAEMINHLIVEGSQSRSPIQCDICSRVFPREKSLQAHKRTHSGDRPYTCDFPNCGKAFVQSGQLKTHQRLHTGEKPFVCTVDGCESRFTHANRHCPMHPKAGLVRKDSDVIPLKGTLLSEIQNKEPNDHTRNVLIWLNKYEREKQNKSPGSLKPERLHHTKAESRRETRRDRERDELSISERRMARKEARKRMAEQKERWIGALALVELAELAANTMPASIHKSLNFFPPHELDHVEFV